MKKWLLWRFDKSLFEEHFRTNDQNSDASEEKTHNIWNKIIDLWIVEGGKHFQTEIDIKFSESRILMESTTYVKSSSLDNCSMKVTASRAKWPKQMQP